MHHRTLFKRIYNNYSHGLFSSSYVEAKFIVVVVGGGGACFCLFVVVVVFKYNFHSIPFLM